MKMIAVRSGLVLLCLVVATTLAVKWFTGSPETPAPAIRNVLLISLDTCRADHLGSYGFPPPPMSVSTTAISPHIDAVAAEGTLFENVISTVPQTLPAHSSMLTGTIPPYHGVHDNTGYLADPPNVTLAEILKAAGFATGAAISAFVLDHQFGLDTVLLRTFGQGVPAGPAYDRGPGRQGLREFRDLAPDYHRRHVDAVAARLAHGGERFLDVARAGRLANITECYGDPGLQVEAMLYPNIEYFLSHGDSAALQGHRSG